MNPTAAPVLHTAMLYVTAPSVEELRQFLDSVGKLAVQQQRIDVAVIQQDTIPLVKVFSA